MHWVIYCFLVEALEFREPRLKNIGEEVYWWFEMRWLFTH